MKKKHEVESHDILSEAARPLAQLLGWDLRLKTLKPPTKAQLREIHDADQKFRDAIAKVLKAGLIEQR